MTVADSSVIVAAFASWHEHHERANAALTPDVRLIGHCAIEVYSVLTRLPPPHRVPAAVVGSFLSQRFKQPYVALSARDYRDLVGRLVERRITGGAAYDALVAATALASEATLLSCDVRALATYDRFGVDYRLVAA